jgi:site-specific DNA recombinase
MNRAAIYCRVSTDGQERDGTSLETQLNACLAYCQEKSYEVTHRYRETYSGLTLERPELEKLREMVRGQQIDIVVVHSLDRLSRDPVHGVIIAQELDKYVVTLEAVTETVENTDLGRLITYVKGFSAKLEAQKIAERTKRGKAHLVSRGILPIGTGAGLYGYSWDKKAKKRVRLEFEARVVEKIFTMMADGQSRFKVAQTLNIQGIPTKSDGGKWHPLTIQRMITNPAYMGITYFYRTLGSHKTELVPQPQDKWVTLPDVTPAIISKELFERVQKQLERTKEARTGRPTHQYMLRGHAYCGVCGRPLVGSCLNKRWLYYRCRATTPTSVSPKSCNARCIKAGLLESLVWDKVKAVLSDPEIVTVELNRIAELLHKQAGDNNVDKEIVRLRRQVKEYDGQEKRLISALRTGELNQDFVLDEMGHLKKDRVDNGKRLDELQQLREKLTKLENAEIQLPGLQSIVDRIDQCTYEEKRLALDALDIKVKATRDRVEISGIIPVDVTSTQSLTEGQNPIHHCTNMGMTTWV